MIYQTASRVNLSLSLPLKILILVPIFILLMRWLRIQSKNHKGTVSFSSAFVLPIKITSFIEGAIIILSPLKEKRLLIMETQVSLVLWSKTEHKTQRVVFSHFHPVLWLWFSGHLAKCMIKNKNSLGAYTHSLHALTERPEGSRTGHISSSCISGSLTLAHPHMHFMWHKSRLSRHIQLFIPSFHMLDNPLQ